MPTLFRLLTVLAVFFAASYGALLGLTKLVQPQPREIVEAVALPPSPIEVHTGRSVAEVLDHQASALVHHRKHPPR